MLCCVLKKKKKENLKGKKSYHLHHFYTQTINVLQKNWCVWIVVLGRTLGSPLDCKDIQPVYPKGAQSWVFIGRTDVEAETQIHEKWIIWPPDTKSWLILKRPWCWERLKAGGEGDNRRWDGWMASLTQWTWVWVNSRSWWWTGRPGVGHDGVTELKWKV